MAILFCDGFDGYTAHGDLNQKWNDIGSATGFNATGGRYGGPGLSYSSAASNGYVRVSHSPAGSAANKFHASMAIKRLSTNADNFLSFWGSDGIGAGINLFANTVAATTVNVRRGSTDLTTFSMSNSDWVRLEIEITRHATTGTIRIWVNGALVVNYTGNTGTTLLTDSRFMYYSTGNLDDVLLWDETDNTLPTPLNDFRIYTQYVNGAGDSAQGTPTGAVTNWECVKDTGGSDKDSTYSALQTSGHKDLYALQDLPVTPDSIYVVNVNCRVRSESSTSRAARLLVKSSTTEVDNGANLDVPNQASYKLLQAAFTKDPATAATWNKAGVDAMQIGVKVVA